MIWKKIEIIPNVFNYECVPNRNTKNVVISLNHTPLFVFEMSIRTGMKFIIIRRMDLNLVINNNISE